jgi:hypothetical protein
VRVDGAGPSAIALVRIRCNLAAASPELVAQFDAQYAPNRNPKLTAVSATVDGAAIALERIRAGSRVSFTVGWTQDSRERYAVYDVLAQTLVEHREAMSVAWYATDGAFADERTGSAESDEAQSTTNQWTAPSHPGPVYSWIVLRDNRGGVDFASVNLVVIE